MDAKVLQERILSEEEIKKLNEWSEVLIEFFKILGKRKPKDMGKIKNGLERKRERKFN